MDPTLPSFICPNKLFSSVIGPVCSHIPEYWFIWPTFSSRVRSLSKESTLCSIVFFCASGGEVVTNNELISDRHTHLFFPNNMLQSFDFNIPVPYICTMVL